MCAAFILSLTHTHTCTTHTSRNHLDLFAVLWLEDYLVKWPKTLLVVSHAREFLNAVCTDILHLHSHQVTTYK